MSDTNAADGVSIGGLPATTTVNPTDLVPITQGYTVPGTGVTVHVSVENLLGGGSGAPYDIAGGFSGLPGAGQTIWALPIVRSIAMPQGLVGSQARCLVAPTADVALTIQNNGTTIGSINYALGQTAGTFTFAALQDPVAGNELTVIAPGSSDATFAGPYWVFACTR